MRIQTELISFTNSWTTSSSYDCQAHQQHSQKTMLFFPDFSSVIRGASRLVAGALSIVIGSPRLVPCCLRLIFGAPTCSQTYENHSHGTPVPFIVNPSYSEGRPECPPSIWYSAEIDTSKFALHILSDTAGGSQQLQFILLMSLSLQSTSRTICVWFFPVLNWSKCHRCR